MSSRGHIALIVGALIVVLLQILVAPLITILGTQPNFILAYIVAIAIGMPRNCGYVMPFVLGLSYDLIESGPVGAMALLCVLGTFAISKLSIVFSNDSLFIPLMLLVLGIFSIELIYGILLCACGTGLSFVDVLLQRSLPCGLYDTVLGLIMVPLVMRFIVNASGGQDGLAA